MERAMEDGFAGSSNLPGGDTPKSNANLQAQKKLQKSQAQVDEVVGIMRVNVQKVLERDSKLSDLDNMADQLQMGASQFEQQATRLKRRMWWKNLKMMIILGLIGLIFAIIFITWIWSAFAGESTSNP
ncbi:unnamed protein product [Bemisia tabaci]|uniref:V-SNARE coiled-coil homology domain-containing protein n=2 Tax=Bemisia tabaci TaxID=7038 RepID=A0A9P0A619_BEMTA|nr:unnamed protein product [Bemisia tabaci]